MKEPFKKPDSSALKPLGEFECASIRNYYDAGELVISGVTAHNLRLRLIASSSEDKTTAEDTQSSIERVGGRLFLKTRPCPDVETLYVRLVTLDGKNKMLGVNNREQELIAVYGEERDAPEKESIILLPMVAVQTLGKGDEIIKTLQPVVSRYGYKAKILQSMDGTPSLEVRAEFSGKTSLEDIVRKNQKIQRLSSRMLASLLR